MASAIEVCQSFGCCCFYLLQIRYQQRCIDERLVTCQYLCLKPSPYKFRIMLLFLEEQGMSKNEKDRNLMTGMDMRLVGSI